MLKRKVSVVLFVVLLASIYTGVMAAPPDDYRTLSTVTSYSERHGWTGWAGSDIGSLEVEDNFLPIDHDVPFDGKPSLRVNVNETPGTWWVGLVNLNLSNTVDLTEYYNNGVLEFYVKGDAGGERVQIGFKDHYPERSIGDEIETKRLITDFGTITTDWQKVTVPLKDVMDLSTGFDPSRFKYFLVSKYDNTPLKIWIADIRVTSPDDEQGYPAVKVNQVGYPTDAEKYALVSGFDGELTAVEGTSFDVKRASDGAVVDSGTLSLVDDYDAEISGERVLKADFTSLTTEGTYYISVHADGVADSVPFKIGDNLYDQMVIDAQKYFYYQRANIDLLSEYAGTYDHPAWHTEDFDLPFKSDPNKTANVGYGWYDAGDFGKFVNNSATAMSDMLWAYETYPSLFTDDQLNIPESGNGIPDLLDEIKFNLDWVLSMQDPDTGGFYHRIEAPLMDSVRYINDMNGTSAGDVKSTPVTGSAVGVLAHAYMVYKDIDPTFADTLLNAANDGWTYLLNNPDVIATEDSGPYRDSDDTDNRLWAAASLYRATGDSGAHTYFLDHYQNFADSFDTPVNAYSWNKMELAGFMAYMHSSAPDSTVVDWFHTKFANYRSIILGNSESNTWRNTFNPDGTGAYLWGGNAELFDTSIFLIMGSELTDTYDSHIVKAVRANMNYVLGVNPVQRSYVSGYGDNAITKIYSGIYSNDGKTGIPDGILSGGPNKDHARHLSRFDGKTTQNVDTDFFSNEQTINWNATLIFNAAYMMTELSTEPSAQSYELESLTAWSDSGDPISNITDSSASGGELVKFDSDSTTDDIQFYMPVTETGTYTVKVGVKKYSTRGEFQFSIDGTNLGEQQDLYSSSATYEELTIGTVTFDTTGDKRIKFYISGQNASSSGYDLALDYVKLVP